MVAGTAHKPADEKQRSLFDHRGNQLGWLRLLPAASTVATQYGTVSGAACLAVIRMVDELVGDRRSPRIKIATIARLTKLSRSTVCRALAALKGDAFTLALIADGRVDGAALSDALEECGMALLSVNEQFGARGRAPGEFTILWPALRALVEAGKFHGETAGGVMEKPTSFHHETAGGSTKKLTSFHGETSLPPSSASDLSASDPPNTHEGVQKSRHDDSPTADQVQALYSAYPRKIARGAAMKAIERALRDTDFETLMEAVRVFANSSAGRAGKFCPYPSTWFNRRQWEDDRQEWDRPATRKRAFDPTPYQKFIAEREGGK
jgi:hypothetical protein